MPRVTHPPHRPVAPAPIQAPAPRAPVHDAPRTTTPARPDRFDRDLAAPWAHRLEDATHVRRSTGPEGREKVLTAHERARVETLLRDAPADLAGALEEALRGLDGPHAAVVLRAVAARAAVLAADPRELAEVVTFATRVRPLDGAEVRRRATSLDLDSRRNDSPVDPIPLWDRRGVIRARPGDAGAADNDGLFQRFTASCGTTVLQMMLAEADPVYAFELHENGIQSDATNDRTARFQRRVLEAGGGIALGRAEATLRSRLRNALGRLHRDGEVTATQKEALLDHVLRRRPLDGSARRALSACRDRWNGFPTEEEIHRLRARPLPSRDEGLDASALNQAMHTLLTPLTGIRYRPTDPPEGFGRGQAARHLDDVARALAAGIDIPFGTSEPAHWMLLSAVRGQQPDRHFLVSDPDGGRTAWVTERDFVSGEFADTQFHISKKTERPWVDTFFLPLDR